MSVSGNDLPALERAPEVLSDDLRRDIIPDLGLHRELPAEDLLVCQSEGVRYSRSRRQTIRRSSVPMKGTGKSKKSGRVCEIWIG